MLNDYKFVMSLKTKSDISMHTFKYHQLKFNRKLPYSTFASKLKLQLQYSYNTSSLSSYFVVQYVQYALEGIFCR